MAIKELMAIIHVGKDVYIVDRKAYYLMCRMQEVNFNRCEDTAEFEDRYHMYRIVLDWLIDNKRAVKMNGKPIHLIIKGNEDAY